jgi:maltose 6'-phosphate phosphatase
MYEIQLLYVENIITRKKSIPQQELCFVMRVANLSHDKKVEVLWAGEQGEWQVLSASYQHQLSADDECWKAKIIIKAAGQSTLPGNINFALLYECLGQEYWDNQAGSNYDSQADSGIQLTANQNLQQLDFQSKLKAGQQRLPITISVNQALQAKAVTLYWTTDNWLTSHKTPCHFNRHYWHEHEQSNARNPNQYGSQIWQGVLKIKDAYRVVYSISYDTVDGVLWDNNEGNNYKLSHEPLKLMILNLHCYQEAQQDKKFSQIAKAIDDLDVDIVCFQEVAELWNEGLGDWQTHSANIINNRLKHAFHLYSDWSHLGFDKYREGVAILSRYPLHNQAARYVSDSDSIFSIHARKVIMAQVNVPTMGLINVFSAHLSWWEDGFSQQFKKLSSWASELQDQSVSATLLCGDFNITSGSEGYQLVVNTNEYEDQFLAIQDQRAFEKIFKVNDAYWSNSHTEEYRIDYIFMNKASKLKINSGRVLFTDDDYGRVSDHCGYLMSFEPK